MRPHADLPDDSTDASPKAETPEEAYNRWRWDVGYRCTLPDNWTPADLGIPEESIGQPSISKPTLEKLRAAQRREKERYERVMQEALNPPGAPDD